MIWKIPLADLDFGPEETGAVQRVMESKWLTMGAVTQQFEEEFAAFTGARFAFGVTNCTAGLHLACLAAGIQPGDEVIVPSLTFVATAAAILYCQAVPVFADISSPNDLTLSPASIEACLTERTRAIMVMHYGGNACDMQAIQHIAEKHHLAVIEDAAHAVGATLNGKSLGTWGAVGCYSFFSNKNLSTGEGGMIVTGDEEIARKIRLLRSHGMTSLTWDRHQGHAWSYNVVDLGYNYRIDEIRSAIGIEQLHKLPGGNERRRHLCQLYRQRLSSLAPTIAIPFKQPRGDSSHHIFPILLPQGVNRNRFMEFMKSEGIQTSIHYPPIHQFDHYSHYGVTLPITEEVAAREVTLPLHPRMLDEDVDTVVNAINRAVTITCEGESN